MKRNKWVEGFKKEPWTPIVVWGMSSPDIWTLSIVYDIGPSVIFEKTGPTIYNAINLDGYPTSFSCEKYLSEAIKDGSLIPLPQFKHKSEEWYNIAKEKCKKLEYDTSRMP